MRADRRTHVTPRVTARAGLGLALLAVLTATGCAGERGLGSAGHDDSTASATPAAETSHAETPSPPDVVPWEAVDAFLDARRGRYTEVLMASEDGYVHQTVLQEIIRFDLDEPYIERTVRIPTEMAEEGDPVGDLKFVYTDTALLMWHPGTLEQCGTHWIDMSEAPYTEMLGFDVRVTDFLAVKPLQMLTLALAEPTLVETTQEGSTYEVTVPAESGISLSGNLLDDPAVAEAISGMDAVAEVILPPAGGSLKMSIDFTEVYRAIDEKQQLPADFAILSSWTVTPDIPPFSTSLPTDVADIGCMDPDIAT